MSIIKILLPWKGLIDQVSYEDTIGVNRLVTKHLVCQSALNLTECLLWFYCLKIKCIGVEAALNAL
jgi:hypothetical protein